MIPNIHPEDERGIDSMKITVLGAGAMGMLFSGYFSRKNEVWVVDVDESRVE